MSVHYKFKNNAEYNTVTFDGVHISVGDLKKMIIQQKKVGKSPDCDLQITDAESKKAYVADDQLIPKNSSVIVARVPLAEKVKKVWTRGEEITATAAPSSLGRVNIDKITRSDLSEYATEEEKIKAMVSQSTADYDSVNYVKSKSITGPLPSWYTCYRCGQSGHHIKHCPTNQIEIKRSTGIPKSFLRPATADDKGALMTATGDLVVPIIDGEAYKHVKKDKPAFANPNEPTDLRPKMEIPEDFQCTLCMDIIQDAVMTPCCSTSFCDDCIRKHLMEADIPHQCPKCDELDVTPEKLIPFRKLRKDVMKFINDTGYTHGKDIVFMPKQSSENINDSDNVKTDSPSTVTEVLDTKAKAVNATNESSRDSAENDTVNLTELKANTNDNDVEMHALKEEPEDLADIKQEESMEAGNENGDHNGEQSPEQSVEEPDKSEHLTSSPEGSIQNKETESENHAAASEYPQANQIQNLIQPSMAPLPRPPLIHPPYTRFPRAPRGPYPRPVFDMYGNPLPYGFPGRPPYMDPYGHSRPYGFHRPSMDPMQAYGMPYPVGPVPNYGYPLGHDGTNYDEAVENFEKLLKRKSRRSRSRSPSYSRSPSRYDRYRSPSRSYRRSRSPRRHQGNRRERSRSRSPVRASYRHSKSRSRDRHPIKEERDRAPHQEERDRPPVKEERERPSIKEERDKKVLPPKVDREIDLKHRSSRDRENREKDHREVKKEKEKPARSESDKKKDDGEKREKERDKKEKDHKREKKDKDHKKERKSDKKDKDSEKKSHGDRKESIKDKKSDRKDSEKEKKSDKKERDKKSDRRDRDKESKRSRDKDSDREKKTDRDDRASEETPGSATDK
ncbi:E3 ubiquitin-protein ligase RBBP6 [Halotydeus destructor]|nr:E3 ubiquitin-protein ligase RBBP6 [Halotydeus destructor]